VLVIQSWEGLEIEIVWSCIVKSFLCKFIAPCIYESQSNIIVSKESSNLSPKEKLFKICIPWVV
jgi:hypothetical protein